MGLLFKLLSWANMVRLNPNRTEIVMAFHFMALGYIVKTTIRLKWLHPEDR